MQAIGAARPMGRTQSKSSQMCPRLGRSCPRSTKLGPWWADFGRIRPGINQTWSECDQTRPAVARNGPEPAKFGPTRNDIWPDVGPKWLGSIESGPKLGPAMDDPPPHLSASLPPSAKEAQNIAQIGALSDPCSGRDAADMMCYLLFFFTTKTFLGSRPPRHNQHRGAEGRGSQGEHGVEEVEARGYLGSSRVGQDTRGDRPYLLGGGQHPWGGR